MAPGGVAAEVTVALRSRRSGGALHRIIQFLGCRRSASQFKPTARCHMLPGAAMLPAAYKSDRVPVGTKPKSHLDSATPS